jgi:translation initiation factor IF-3
LIKKSKRKQEQKKFYRVNDRVFASPLRVLDSEGKQIGLLTKNEALDHAIALGLDLVEIAPQASPPVAKIIDYKKFLYQEEKKKREEKRKAKVSETKEIRLGPFMSNNDLQVMVKRGREFLEEGDKVRMVLKFKGRQITHPEFGHQVMGKAIDALSDLSKVDREPHLEGKQLIGLVSPERKKQNAEKKDQTSSIETI